MKSFFIFVLLIIFVQIQAQNTYRNPVIAGDFPDPSIIRVGDTYYAAGTSSEWSPPYRLYESKDLINWQYLGGLFEDLPDWTMGSFWAPELYYENGTYFVYYTARRRSDKKSFIGVATTKNIHQGFTDHGIIIEWTNEAIDAYVIALKGKRYITWKAYGLDKGKTIEILGAELSPDGLKIVGEAFHLLTADRDNWEAGGIEGQSLVDHGEYLYLFYAGNNCCGRNCNYQTGVARAKSIRGPWEKYDGNPILYGDDQWRCSGHGTLVETPEKRYFYMYHAYNALTNVSLGRQGMLDEIVWNQASGWPAFRYGKTPSLQAENPIKQTEQKPVSNFSDDFLSSSLAKEWVWDVSQKKPHTTIDDGILSLQGNETLIGNFLGLQIKKGNCSLTVSIPENTSVSSGICVYGTHENGIGLSVKNGKLELWQVLQNKRTILAEKPIEYFPISLCISMQWGQRCQFSLISGKQSQTIGNELDLSQLPQWDRPPMVGIQVQGNNTGVFDKVVLDYNNNYRQR